MNMGTEPKAPLLLLHVVTGVSPLHTLCYLYSTLCYLYSFFDNQEREAATRTSKALAGGGGGSLHSAFVQSARCGWETGCYKIITPWR